MSKIWNIWNACKSYVVMIVACILLLIAKAHVVKFLDKAVYWLDGCSMKRWKM